MALKANKESKIRRYFFQLTHNQRLNKKSLLV